MPRPPSEKIAVVCLWCSEKKFLPPGEARRTKYCSRPCATDGRAVTRQWDRIIDLLESRGEVPAHACPLDADPQDRIRVRGQSVYVRRGDGWMRFTAGRSPVKVANAPRCSRAS